MAQNEFQNISEIKQRFPISYFGRATLRLTDDKLIWHHKNIFREFHREFNLNNIAPEYDILKQEYDNYANLIWFFAFLVLIVFSLGINFTLTAILACLFLFLAGLCFAMRFVKYEYAQFRDHTNNYLFGIRFSRKTNKEKEFANNIIKTIKDKKSN